MSTCGLPTAGSAARLAKLTSDIEGDVFDNLESMSAEEFDAFLEQDWIDATPFEKERLTRIAKDVEPKIRAMLVKARE